MSNDINDTFTKKKEENQFTKKKTLKSKFLFHYNNLKPILLSHHPLCEKFQNGNHTFKMFGIDFCIGCFITYPVAIGFYIFGNIFRLFSLFSIATLWYLGFGFCAFYLLSIFGLTKKREVKIFSKIMIGLGISFCVSAMWNLNFSVLQKLVMINIYFIFGHVIINSIRTWEIYKTCKNCEYDFNWGECPGMSPILVKDEIKKEN